MIEPRFNDVMSTYLISIYFSEETNEHIGEIIKRVAVKTSNDSMSGVPAHITVGMINVNNPDEAVLKVKKISETINSFNLILASVGMFGSKTVFIQPILSKELEEVCSLTNAMFNDIIHVSSRYKPYEWIPHITIAKHLTHEQQLEAIKILQSEKIYRIINVSKIGLATTKPYKDVVVYDL